MGMNVIGISALYHDSACCILKDGVLAAAAQEERFTRLKADASMPFNAFMYCLEEAGLTIADIDCVAYYEDPEEKLSRQIWSRVPRVSEAFLRSLDPGRPEREIRSVLGYEGEIKLVKHHLSHAASSFYFSGYEESAILTVDGVGEWATTSYGTGTSQPAAIRLFEEVHFPDSLGLLYSTVTSYLGFDVNDGEYKVMGLAPYGTPLHVDKFRKLIEMGTDGQFRLDMSYFDFLSGQRMYAEKFIELFGVPPRKKDSGIQQFHKDVAKSLQVMLEEVLLDKVRYLHRQTGMENLCMAGGVALNCVANGRIQQKGPFKRLFVQPAANDAGGALGAAAIAHIDLAGAMPVKRKMHHAYLGPGYRIDEIDRLLQATSLKYDDFRADDHQLLSAVARRLADGKVIGWFHGRMEFGPRALGARSILADPRNAGMRDLINAMVKKREGFRPFAPAVLEDKAREHFALDVPSPFMLATCQVISQLDLPAITHVDGSARVQTVSSATNPRFAALLSEFEHLTCCPILLNTSFNVKGEPIVCTPEDALKCFITTNIDCLVLEDFIIDRSENSLSVLEMIINTYREGKLKRAGISRDMYTFV